MRVAIIGAGAIGLGGAACLQQNGHEPVIWSPRARGTAALGKGKPLVVTGAITGEFRPHVAESCAEALVSAEAVLASGDAEQWLSTGV